MSRHREPIWKRFQEWWPLIAVLLAGIGWIINQMVSYREQSSKLSEHEKRLDADERFNEQKHSTQDRQIIESQVQNQEIQRALGEISQQLKGRR